jgi:PAS domain S-box-containing protein
MGDDRKKTILLVEDDAILAMACARKVRAFGYEVLTAMTGEEAVECVASRGAGGGIDLILMDIDLGAGIDGTEAAGRILGIRDLPVVFLTSHSEEAFVERVKRITRYGYVIKDSGDFVLRSSIEMAFELFGANVELKARMEEQARAEERLRESERRFRNIVSSSPMGMHVYELKEDGRLVFTGANPAADAILGVTNAAFIGKTIEEAFPPLASTEVPARYRRVASLGETWHGEEVDYDDEVIRGAYEVVAFQVSQDVMAVMFHDITERKRAEEAAKAGERNYREIFNSTAEAIFIHDATTGRILDVNDATLKAFGFASKDEVLSGTVGDISAGMGEWTEERAQAAMHRAAEEGPQTFEWLARRKNGTHFWLEMTLRKTEIGGRNRILAVGRDISERKVATAVLRRSDEQFRSLVHDMQVGVVLQDAQAQILLCNPRALEYLGLSEDQLLGRTSFDPDWNVIHEDGSPFPGQEHPVPVAIATGKSVRNVVMGVHRPRPGDRVWLLVDAVPELDPAGVVRQVVCTFIDITERKVAEAKVEGLLAEKEMILREVHHRVKNNMNIITSLLALQASSSGDPALVAALGEAENRVRSMMLLYDKLYRSQAAQEVRASDYLGDLMDSLIATFPFSASVEVGKSFDDSVLDAKRLSTLGIITNELVTNIMKYAFAGREGGRIDLSLRREGQDMRLEVADDGVGMPEGVDSASTTGFGLTLVDMLAAQLKGRMRIERGKGTRVVLEFPL